MIGGDAVVVQRKLLEATKPPGAWKSWTATIDLLDPVPWTQATAASPDTSPAATRPWSASVAPSDGSETTWSGPRSEPSAA